MADLIYYGERPEPNDLPDEVLSRLAAETIAECIKNGTRDKFVFLPRFVPPSLEGMEHLLFPDEEVDE